MKLSKPLNNFSKKEVKEACEEIRGLENIEIGDCNLNPWVCHFRLSPFCPRAVKEHENLNKKTGG